MFEIGPFEYTFKDNSKKIYCDKKILIKDKELVIITGPSGSGKSTILQMLKGIIPEYSSGKFEGLIHYKNKAIAGELFQQNLSEILFLFQNPFSQLIYPSVPEEFFFTMENFNFTREQMDHKKMELKASFDLDLLWHKKTTELSHGECQRLVLASLLATNPKVLLLDEPTAFLDTNARTDFYNWLKKIKGSQTIFVVDHHLNEVLHLADRIIHVTQKGEVTESKSIIESNEKKSFIKLKNIMTKNESVLLSLSKVYYHYPDQFKLLENINFQISSGEILVIKGKNGKGKSTLLKILAGLISPLSGTIEIRKNNKIIPVKKHYKEMGFVFQNPESHFFYDTIEEELKSVANFSDMKALLELFFKDIDLKRSPFLLSEGEKRRLSILMTIFLDKTIILYDEPTFGQDQESIAAINEIILELQKMKRIQIIISHDEDFIESLGPKVIQI